MSIKNNNNGSQSGFFASLDKSGASNGQWSHIELIDSSPHAMTQIFKAQRYGKLFALKCLKKEYRDDINAIALLEKEFDIGFNLRHKNIATTLDFTTVPSLGKCIVMEWIDGITLNDYLLSHTTNKNEARSIALQLLDALECVHSHQVVHRDLKPSNVMITSMGKQVKLIDFGLSDTSTYTSFKHPAGTPGYVAPELLSGESNGDMRSDIYSIGVMMKELHPSLSKVAHRCMSANPDERFQSIAQVRKALTQSKVKWWWAVAMLVAVVAIILFIPHQVGNHQDEKSIVVEDTTSMMTNDVFDLIKIQDKINPISAQTTAVKKANDAVITDETKNELTDDINANDDNIKKEEAKETPSGNSLQHSPKAMNGKAEVGSESWCESIFLPIWKKYTTGMSPETMIKTRRRYILDTASIEFKSACEEEFDKSYPEKDREYWLRHSVMESNISKILRQYSN